MSVVLTSPRLAPNEPNSPIVRRIDRAERRRLARHDRDSARSAELHGIRALTQRAVALVSSGWVQHSWFAITDERGQTRMVSARDVWDVTSQPVSGACLVGAIVHAGGGPSVVHSQIVQRSLDLTWHTLYGDSLQPVRWCPPPAVRMANVRDLTAWNDHPTRTATDVEALLQSTARATAVQAELCRAR